MKYQLFLVLHFSFYLLCSCDNSVDPKEKAGKEEIRSVMLYDQFDISLDSIRIALKALNQIIQGIDSRIAGYQLYQVQNDSIKDYRYMIQCQWPDQSVYDRVHQDSTFRRELNIHSGVFDHTRKWKVYRRFERVFE